jgi:hypothetical protein
MAGEGAVMHRLVLTVAAVVVLALVVGPVVIAGGAVADLPEIQTELIRLGSAWPASADQVKTVWVEPDSPTHIRRR